MKKYISKALKILSLNELRILPAYLAYNFVLALLPIFTVIFLITSFFSISTTSIINLINDIIPNYIGSTIVNVISSRNYNISIGFLNIFTLYASSRGMYGIIAASNSLYNIKETNFVKDRFKSILILFLLILSLLFLLLVPIIGDKILSLLGQFDIITNNAVLIYRIIKWPITFLVIYFNVKIIYIISPSVKIKSTDVVIGSFVTALGWMLFTFIFGHYLDYFSRYDAVYGSLSAIAVLLIWMYVLSYILILGIVINTRKYNDK